MSIILNEIKKVLTDFIIFGYTRGDLSQNIKSVKLYDNNAEILPGFLYIGTASALPPIVQNLKDLNIICVFDAALPQIYLEADINLLAVDQKISFPELYSRVQEVLAQLQGVSGGIENLLDTLVHGRGPQHILDIGYELLSNPIVMLNERGKLLARTAAIQMDDPLWEELILNGSFSQKMMNFISKEWPGNESEMAPTLLKSKELKRDRIACKIKLDNQVVATLVVKENNRRFEKKDYGTISLLCQLLSKELQNSAFYKNPKSALYEALIYDLLEGKITDTELIEKRIHNLSWNLKEFLSVLVADIRHYDNNISSLAYFRDLFEKVTDENSYTFIYNNFIVMLTSKSDREVYPKEDMIKLEQLVKENNICCGISQRFSHLIDIKKAYDEAMKALNLGIQLNKSISMYYYCDVQIFCMLESLAENKDGLDFCNPIVLELVAYDKKNLSSYAETLYTYLKSGKNSIKSSKILHIHRNTMCYRLSKIDELGNIDWDNGNQLTQLYLSFGILKLKGLINFPLI